MRGCRPICETTTSRSSSRGRRRLERVAIRHTVGLDDRIEGEGGVADADENAGARYFKLKLNGDPEHDAARLTRIGNELATLPHDYRVTLDANEQYADLDGAWRAGRPARSRRRATADRRKTALYRAADAARYHTGTRRSARLRERDFIIDEADDCYDAFPVARALGYRGISSKSCKGIYKSIVNATRAAKWSGRGRKILHHRRGPDLSGRPWRAAGPRARRPDRRHPCRAQRPSLCRRFCRYARRGGGGLSSRRIPISIASDGDKVRLADP